MPPSTAPRAAGLLARKGEAQPASCRAIVAGADEADWGDLGPPAVVQQRIRLERALTGALPGVTDTKKAAFTLRLDADRHRRLRMAAAITGRSAQALLTDVLDRLLDAVEQPS